MGWITNISFPEGLELNGTKIIQGMSTQIRWDNGIGRLSIDKTGKIIPDSVVHHFPLSDEEAVAYQKELATWTGILDTNMGPLFLKEGQLHHLDLSYEEVGPWIVNHGDFESNSSDGNLYRSLSATDFDQINEVLNKYREMLLDPTPLDKDDYALDCAKKAYQGRSGELSDPYYKSPTPNGFIRA